MPYSLLLVKNNIISKTIPSLLCIESIIFSVFEEINYVAESAISLSLSRVCEIGDRVFTRMNTI